MTTQYAIIGDVHSQAEPLKKALDHCYINWLTPILLGDLFDSQCEKSDSVTVYKLAQQAQTSLGAVILRSNHQFLLEQLAKKEPIPLKKDLARTVRDFTEAGICIQEVASWLETFPYIVAVKDSSGLEYRIAHAEIPDTIQVPENYGSIWQFFSPTTEELRLLLWGKEYTLPDKERFWWLHPNERTWIEVAGHYHKVIRRNNSLVLDAGCGGKTRSWYDKRPPELLLYEIETKHTVGFLAV